MFDARDLRSANLDKHVPKAVLFLLLGVFIAGGSTLGCASGLAGCRPSVATLSLNLLVLLAVFIIVDFDPFV
ncbi:MAG: hypothetical protein KJN60_08060 [Boseongicola sp.]|nr:hypothetical protein [Boseongicola sp.]